MAQQHLAAGDAALVDEEYEDALKNYTAALDEADLSATSTAVVLERRAHALIKLERYLDAVQDAGKAIELDASCANAHLRKGVACFHLEEYEAALDAFTHGAALSPSSSKFATWIKRARAELDDGGESVEAAAAAAAAAAIPTVTAAPAPQPASAVPAPAPATPAAAGVCDAMESVPAGPSAPAGPALSPAAPPVTTGKYRHQWYQLGGKVVVDVFAKGQRPEDVRVDVTDDDDAGSRLRIVIADTEQQQEQQVAAGAGGGTDYVLELALHGRVLPDAVRTEVLRTKVEVSLTKAVPGQAWPALDRGCQGVGAAGVGVAAGGASASSDGGSGGVARLYPSSKGPKDWGKVEAEVKELEDKGELDEGDPLNAFFKKIFSQGDEDTRRAMMKSFVESNGTVLSTNWQEVGAKKVDCTPPEGMELHKWNEQ